MTRIYGLMIAKNEADIIAQSLVYALNHCEKVIVMDNMSTDGTWEIVENLAVKYPERIIAHCRLEQGFHDCLRAIAYNAYRHELGNQDWWLRLDADEFLNERPAETLKVAIAENADFVRANQMQFALTDVDVATIERGEDSRDQPIEQRRRHYRVNWREFRFFRNDPNIGWDVDLDGQFPQNLSKDKICSRAIFNRHYVHRDIEQLKTRIAVRQGSSSFAHVSDADWKTCIVAANTQHVWSADAPVAFAPVTDFWIPRIKLELAQRLGFAQKAAA